MLVDLNLYQTQLLQDTQNATFEVKPDKTYLLRIVNIGSFVGSYFEIDDHTLTIVEVDGVYTEPQETKQIYLTVGQRYSVLVKTKHSSHRNFAIKSALDTNMFDHIPTGFNGEVYGFLVYNTATSLPATRPIQTIAPFDDFHLVPEDHQEALKVDRQIVITMNFINDTGVNRYEED